MKTSDEITKKVLEKLAAISSEDIASALAGRGRELSPEEIEEFAKELGRTEALKNLKLNLPLGVLGGGTLGLGLGLLSKKTKKPVLSALMGLLAGGSLAGLQYARGQEGIKEKGRALGEAIQEGILPTRLPSDLSSSFLYPMATGFQRGLEQDISPGEYQELKRALRRHAGKRGAIVGASLGIGGNILSVGERPLAPVVGGLVGAGGGALLGSGAALREAPKLLDLYHRGYGHLADRLLLQALPEVY